MKKYQLHTFLVAAMLVIAGSQVKAQSVEGKNFVNLGIGIGSFGFSGTGGLPVTASFEHGFTDKISGGAMAGFITRTFGSDYRYSYYVVGARASYHLTEDLKIDVDNLDVYGGLSLFYRGYKLKYKGGEPDPIYKSSSGNINLGIHVGGRYMFSESFGGFAELGYGISPLQLGLTLKF